MADTTIEKDIYLSDHGPYRTFLRTRNRHVARMFMGEWRVRSNTFTFVWAALNDGCHKNVILSCRQPNFHL